MEYTGFSTRSEHRSDRAAAWRRINARYFGDLLVEDLDDLASQEAAMSAFDLGTMRMLRIRAPAHRVRRDSARLETPTDAYYKLVMQLQGDADILQGGQQCRLRSGDWSLYDPRLPYAVTNHRFMDLLVVQVPRDALHSLGAPALRARETGGQDAQGMDAVLGNFLGSLARQLPTLPDGVGQSLGETVTGLLVACLAAGRRARADQASLPGVLRVRTRQFIHAHLADAELNLDAVARAMRCSKRYLHKVFEDEQVSLDRYIWQTRLERCRLEMLEQARERPLISQIAFSWGFNSSAHFCRLFKQQYGVSPSEYLRRL